MLKLNIAGPGSADRSTVRPAGSYLLLWLPEGVPREGHETGPHQHQGVQEP